MNKEIVEMAEYVCDHICPMPEKIFDPEKLESYCNDKCNLKLYLSRALTESESTSLEVHRLTQKYRNVVLCTECVHAYKLPSGNISCGNIQGIDSTKLGAYDGCSHGKRCTTQTPENKGCN